MATMSMGPCLVTLTDL